MKRILYVVTIALLVLFCSCGSPMKSFTSNNNGWKPNDFVPSKGVLLIERINRPKAQQKKIEEFMAKEYSYKYEFIDAKNLQENPDKYADKNIYRFALMSSLSFSNIHENQPSRSALNVGSFDYHFIDRANNKVYPNSGIGSSWASMTFKKIIKTCLEN